MEINIATSYGSIDLEFKADNVHAIETISETKYALKEDGKKDFTKNIGTDIADEYMDMITRLADDAAEYRVAEYDSEGLIKTLFDKLPDNIKQSVVKDLTRELE